MIALAVVLALAILVGFASIRTLRRRVKRLEDAPKLPAIGSDNAAAWAAQVRKLLGVGAI